MLLGYSLHIILLTIIFYLYSTTFEVKNCCQRQYYYNDITQTVNFLISN